MRTDTELHTPEEEAAHFDTLSEIRASVLEASGSDVSGNPVGAAVATIEARMTTRAQREGDLCPARGRSPDERL